MSSLHELWLNLADWAPALVTFLHLTLSAGFIAWVLMSKTDSTSAVAWCLLIILLPFFGPLFFLLFGYQHVYRPLQRKRRHMAKYRSAVPYLVQASPGIVASSGTDGAARVLTSLADRFGAYARSTNNEVDFYHDGPPAFDAMLEALRTAEHHIHLEFFIFHADVIGRQFLEVMTAKARAGVQVRMLYDAMGSHGLSLRALRELMQGGGRSSVFLPLSLLRRRFQINMRNHRKILIVDGKVGFTGGLNIGDEYLGRSRRYGYWRDTHMRIRGPAVEDLQRIFCEDWDFAADERLAGMSDAGISAASRCYFPGVLGTGTVPVQVIDSGPDREFKSIREIYFAAIVNAQKRVWIASPYFVPDAGLLDALRLAGYRGIDVRFLGQLYPDKWIPQFAARYYWDRVLRSGVQVYQYGKGMMHAKVVLVDGQWASVGTANLDNRSLHLNFEVNCLIDSPQMVAHLEEQFLRDLADSVQLQPAIYARRPFAGRLLENACRLLSPVL